jgi:hypothetical protein
MLELAEYGNEALLRQAHQSFPIPNPYSPLHPLRTSIQDLQRANHLTSLLQPVQGAYSLVNTQAGRRHSGNDPIITTPYNSPTWALADWGADVLTGTSNFKVGTLPAMPNQISTRSLLHIPLPVEEQRGQFQLPAVLSRPSDDRQLSRLQSFLRQHIEAFQATEEDMLHVRGRTKKLRIGQVGIRCRHCALVHNRSKGSVYFPTSVCLILSSIAKHVHVTLCSVWILSAAS